MAGVNAVTGEGLAEALAGAQVVVDVANSPSFEDRPSWTSSRSPAVIVSPQKRTRVLVITSPCRLSAPTAFRKVVTFAQRRPRKI
jgi:hypothetical protein